MKNVLSFENSKIIGQAERYHYRVGTSFDLLAGYTCPMAKDCQTFCYKTKAGLRLKWGKYSKYTCYMAASEARFTNVYTAHNYNTEFTKSPEFVEILKQQLWKSGTTLHRWHSGGDFYNWEYFQKIYEITKSLPEIYFYAYSKQASFIKWYNDHKLPNMDMVYSYGGIMDDYADENDLVGSYVVMGRKKYKGKSMTDLGLPIACQDNKYDDLEYIKAQASFGLLVH